MSLMLTASGCGRASYASLVARAVVTVSAGQGEPDQQRAGHAGQADATERAGQLAIQQVGRKADDGQKAVQHRRTIPRSGEPPSASASATAR